MKNALRRVRAWILRPVATRLDELRSSHEALQQRVDEIHESGERINRSFQDMFGDLQTRSADLQNRSTDLHNRSAELARRADDLHVVTQDSRNRIDEIVGRFELETTHLKQIAADLQVLVVELGQRANDAGTATQDAHNRIAELTLRLDVVARSGADFQHRAHDLTGRIEVLASSLAQLRSRLLATPYMSRSIDEWSPVVRSTPGQFDYLGFEQIFRGPESLVRERQAVYLPLLLQSAPVIDVGSGRGEFLELLASAGIDAQGIDSNPLMVEHCREKALTNVRCTGALEYLAERPPNSVGAIFSAQVAEHLTPEDLLSFVSLSLDTLRAGGLFIAETVNPNSIEGSKTFYVDASHVKPLFPEVFAFMCKSVGFSSVRIFYPNGGGFDEPEPTSQHEYAVVAVR